MKRLRNLIADAATYGTGTVLGKFVGFLLLPVYTRHLSPEDYGTLAMLAVASAVFSPLAILGMTNAIFRRFHETKEPQERQAILSTGLISVTTGTLALFALGQCVAEPLAQLLVGSPGATDLLRLTLITAAIGTLGTVPFTVLRIDRRVRAATALNLFRLVVAVSATIWLVVFEQLGMLGVVLGNLLGEVLVTALNFKLTLVSFRFSPSALTWKRMITYGAPFVPHQVQIVGLMYFGHYVVRELLGLHEAGLYTMAIRIIMPLTFVVGSVQKAWVPIKFQIHSEDADPSATFRSLVTYYVAGLSYLWVGVCVWAPDVVQLMTAPAFHGVSLLVPALALVPVTKALYFMFGTGFELTDNTRPAPLVSLAGLIVVVASAFALVPRLGTVGAALSGVLGWLAMTAFIYCLSRRRFEIKYDWRSLALFAAGSSCFVVAGVLLQDDSRTLRVTFALSASLVYPALVLLALSRSPHESARVHALLSHLTRRRRPRVEA